MTVTPKEVALVLARHIGISFEVGDFVIDEIDENDAPELILRGYDHDRNLNIEFAVVVREVEVYD